MFSLHRAHPVRTYRPRFQVLEDRTLLSTCVVDHLADDGGGSGLNGSLRYCITHAVDGDTITFGVTGTINLTGALPDLYHNISINGPGPNLLTVRRDTGGNYDIFTVGATVAISGLTIANGFVSYGGDGGGIFNYGQLTVSSYTISQNHARYGGGIRNDGTLTISNSTIAGNTATGPGGVGNTEGLGGGIYNFGTMTVSNSTVSANSGACGFYGGGVGGIYNQDRATLTVSNSTISGNTAGPASGVGGIGNHGTLTLSNSTISHNQTYIVGGIYNCYGATLTMSNSTIAHHEEEEGIVSDGTLNMRNSIVADNYPDFEGHLSLSGYNLIGYAFGDSGFVDTDLVGTFDNPIDPMLGPLQNHGGPTQTMALLGGSPALNAGDPAQLGVADQRGVVRTGGVNIGAYQASASAFVLTAPATVAAGTPFDVTVKAVDIFGQTAVGYTGTVTFNTSDRCPGVVLPAAYAFTASDQGTHTFSSGFTLMTPGDQTITATDAAGGFSASTVVTLQGAGPAPGRQPSRDPDAALDLVFAGLGDVGLAPSIDFLPDSVSPGRRDRN